MRRVFVLGILGRSQSGKTTVAEFYRDHYGATIVNFADALKDILQDLVELSNGQVHGSLKDAVDPRLGVTPRELMIRLGHGGRGIIGPRVWIDAALRRIEIHAKRGAHLFVVGDVRYANEASSVDVVIKLTRRVTEIDTERSVDEVPGDLIWQTVDNREMDAGALRAAIAALPRPWET